MGPPFKIIQPVQTECLPISLTCTHLKSIIVCKCVWGVQQCHFINLQLRILGQFSLSNMSLQNAKVQVKFFPSLVTKIAVSNQKRLFLVGPGFTYLHMISDFFWVLYVPKNLSKCNLPIGPKREGRQRLEE